MRLFCLTVCLPANGMGCRTQNWKKTCELDLMPCCFQGLICITQFGMKQPIVGLAIQGLRRMVLPRFISSLFRAIFSMKEIENGTEIHRRVPA